jgi:uncharacterized protein (DUF2336 family)
MTSRFDSESEYLLELARDKSKESRAALANIIVELFENRQGALNDRERALMYNILHGVVREIEMSVRQTVAKQLATRPDVPSDLLNLLANDEIEVAFPILTECGLLKDADLIDIIRMRTMEHQLAIAMRHSVSEEVSEALVQTGRESVIVTLLKNQNARISQQTMEYLVEQSQRVDTFQEPILHRRDLKPELAKRMFLWVSAALRQYVLDHFQLDQKTIDDLLEQAAMQEIQAVATESGKKKAAELAEIMRNEGLVTPDMLMIALREGEVPLFVAMFCKLTDLREYLVMKILFEPGGEGLAIACKGIGLGKAVFSSIFTLSQKTKAMTVPMMQSSLPKALAFYDRISQKAAAEVLDRWRRGSDYLSAIRQLTERIRSSA